MNFDYIENTKCLINNKEEKIRLGNGCTGIGSRECWINDKKLPDNILIISDDITKGNHFLYFGCWGERPWDTDYFLVSEKWVSDYRKEHPEWHREVICKGCLMYRVNRICSDYDPDCIRCPKAKYPEEE